MLQKKRECLKEEKPTYVKNKIRVLSVMLGVMFVFSILSTKHVAAATFAGGDGSEKNPYQIKTASQLNEVRNYPTKHFVINNSIDLSSDRKTREWQPIPKFSGKIDGKGHTIKNLNVNQPGSKAGFIAVGSNVRIQDVKFVDINITGENAGAIVSEIVFDYEVDRNNSIKNCSVTGNVKAGNYCGGVVARAEESTEISNCSVNATIIGPASGGIAGQFGRGSIKSSKFYGTISHLEYSVTKAGGIVCYLRGEVQQAVIDGCEVDAKITVSGKDAGYAGGIVASAYDVIIKNCKVEGEIKALTSADGIVDSMNKDSYSVAIDDCENRASVTVTGNWDAYAGGIAAQVVEGKINNCRNYGTITGTKYLGGIAAAAAVTSTIKDSNNYGTLVNTKDSKFTGGILGVSGRYDNLQEDNNQIINCISFAEVTGKNAGTIGGVLGKNTILSACYYVQDNKPVVEGSRAGTVRIGEIANPVIRLSASQMVQSKYPGQVIINPVSSQDTSIVRIVEDQLYGVGVGQTEITFEVSISYNDKVASYRISQIVTVTDDGVFSGGEGTIYNPYIIKTAEQLQLAASYPNAHYMLGNDIDLYAINSFTPIGSYEAPFTGSMDGSGYVIKGLTVTDHTMAAGLFGVAINATLECIYLEDAYITTGQYAGGVVGYADQTQIRDCLVNGEISATTIARNYSGLIVGYMEDGTLKDCCGVGEVKAAYAGVFAGYINITPENCYWYTPYSTKGVAQGTSQSINALKKIDLGIDTLKVGEGVAANVKVKALQPTTNFKLYGTPILYTYKSSSKSQVVKISNNTLVPLAAGTSNIQVIVTFKNGKKVPVDYKVTVKKAMEKVTVSGIKTQWYNNKNLTPGITVMDGKTKLTSKEYSVSYSNNKNPGTAVVTITGKGNYAGTKKVSFAIAIPKVSGVSYTNKTDRINLTWTKVNAIDGYEIYNYSTKKSVTVKACSNTFVKLKAGTSYKYKVRAYKTINNKKVYGAYSDVITTTTKPTVPVVKLATSSKTVKVSWNKNGNATGYEVYMATKSNGKYSMIQHVKKNTVTSYSKKKLSKNKTYYFKVRSYKVVNGKKIYSDYSKVNKIKVK